jgi:hypothetical protein
MTAINRRSLRFLRSTAATLATADDLDGTTDNTQAYDVTGCAKVLIIQVNDGTNGTAGIDIFEVSHDGGVTWAADDTVLLHSSNDTTGTILAAGALNAAGTEPATVLAGVFTAGPWDGPTAIRIGRKTTTTTGTTWITGAPTVVAYVFGGKDNGGAPTALA